ncbi:hypothetical protein MLD38_025987 [Melastoma candidum]|uniref:Uncharacterized protein n=1 Tax=Melastoma candidum TaxID=119954 RepID=A0ACB9P0B2_9MYRT|nr:hypothetical protein MLD38_025987 [Melastoma candidum]
MNYVFHSMIVIFCGYMMMFYSEKIYSLGHDTEVAGRLLRSTPRDCLLIRTSDSFTGLLLFAIGLLLLIVSLLHDKEGSGG